MLLHRQRNLAATFQAALTNIVRLRSRRLRMTSEASFRREVTELLESAEDEAKGLGYSPESVADGKFAVVTFLDNSVLDSRNPAFVQWGGLLLEQECFGTNNGGQIFFERLQRLLDQPASRELADTLEVYQLCLLLGFRGQFVEQEGVGRTARILESAARKIGLGRGEPGELTPTWRMPEQPVVTVARDPWLRRLVYASLGFLVLAVALFAIFRYTLRSHISQLEDGTMIFLGR